MPNPSPPIAGKGVPVCVRIPNPMLEVLRTEAVADDRSVAWVIRRAVAEYLNRLEAARA